MSDIIAKAESIKSVYFETSTLITMDRPLPGWDGVETSKTWIQNGYVRKEILSPTANATKRILVYTPQEAYIYNSYSKETEKRDSGKPLPLLMHLQLMPFQNKMPYTILGSETIDNKLVTVVTLSFTVPDGATYHEKYWFWNEKGVPLKTEIITDSDTGGGTSIKVKIVTVYKNYSFEDIPDGTFDIKTIPEIMASKIVEEDKK